MGALKRRLLSRRGLSLSELLMVLAIMGILFPTIIMGINSAVHMYRRAIIYSDCQTLSSTLSNAIGNELRYAGRIHEQDGGVVFDSESLGPEVSVELGGTGRVRIGGAHMYELLSEDAYTSGLSAVVDSLDYDESQRLFTVRLTVSGPGISARQTSFSVRALNG